MSTAEMIDAGNYYMGKYEKTSKRKLIIQFCKDELGWPPEAAIAEANAEKEDGNEFDYDKFFLWYFIKILLIHVMKYPLEEESERIIESVNEAKKQKKIWKTLLKK